MPRCKKLPECKLMFNAYSLTLIVDYILGIFGLAQNQNKGTNRRAKKKINELSINHGQTDFAHKI